MPKRLTTEIFIERSQKIHGDKYDYDEVNYVNSITKVKIFCNACKKYFYSRPHNHIHLKSGCPECGNIKRSKFFSSSTKEFTKKGKYTHKNKYDYSQSQYKNVATKVIIVCPIHGEFLQTPNDHLDGCGCPKCGNIKCALLRAKSTKQFIIDANKKHNNAYDYSKSKYINCMRKLIIICKKHGEFLQTPDSHLRGAGCPKCNTSKGEHKIEAFLKINNIKFINQKRFPDCKNIQPLPFDFYLPDHNICIEYDGKQHFEPISVFGGVKQFKYTQRNDTIKTNYCKSNKIQLIRIAYTEFDNIESLLEESLTIYQGV